MKKLNLIAVAMEELATEQEEAEASKFQEEELSDSLENVEHLSNETSTAMEAIAQLNVLAAKLKAKEESGISLEAYGDFALIAFNQIKSKIGLEEESEAASSETVSKVKDKVLAALKLILEKIQSFIKVVFDKIKELLNYTSAKAKKFAEFVKTEIIEDKLYDLTPKYYLDTVKVSGELVFGNSNLANYNHNFSEFEKQFQRLEEMFKDVIDGKYPTDLRADTTIAKDNIDFHNGLKGDKSQGNGKRITPDLVIHNNGAYSLTEYTIKPPENQRIMTWDRPNRNENVKDFYSLSLKMYKDEVKFTGDIATFVREKINPSIKNAKNNNSDNMKIFVMILLQLNFLNKAYARYVRDLVAGPNWYMSTAIKS